MASARLPGGGFGAWLASGAGAWDPPAPESLYLSAAKQTDDSGSSPRFGLGWARAVHPGTSRGGPGNVALLAALGGACALCARPG